MSISVILATARDDFPMIERDIHLFQPSLDSLQRQNFKDFELIISDCRYEKRPDCFEGKPFKKDDYNFPIKHITVKPNFWLEHGMWTGPGTWNRGIIEADGELIVFMDDCGEYPNDDALDVYWEWYMKGVFASALCLYNEGGKPLFRDGERVKDSRWTVIGDRPHAYFPGSAYYAYSACSMDAILKVNGWDQNFDGDKAVGDVDLGLRLEQIGCRFVLDRRLTVIENAHNPIPKDTIWYEGRPVRQNYNLMVLNKRRGRYRANSYRLTEKEVDWVRRAGWIDPKIPPDVPLYTPEDPEYELQMWGFKNPPIFDLRELRMLR